MKRRLTNSGIQTHSVNDAGQVYCHIAVLYLFLNRFRDLYGFSHIYLFQP